MGEVKNTLKDKEKEILWLPFCVNCDEDYIHAFSQRLKEYKALAKEKENVSNIEIVNSLCDCLPQILTEFVKGNTLKAGRAFSDLMDSTLLCEIEENEDLWIKDISEGTRSFYRSRKGKYSDSNELKHVPFDKLYLSKDDRYSSQGSVSLYLSTTKEASHVEIGNEDTTTAIYSLHRDQEIKVFDMCAYKINSQQREGGIPNPDEGKSVNTLLPLIVACNSIAYCCPINNTECKSITRNFRIEYVIPQMVASYIKEKLSDQKVRGIRYYTVRNEMLDPSSTDWIDLVLFTEYDLALKHDKFLEEAFDITIL